MGVAPEEGFSKFVGRQICFGNEVKAINLFLKEKAPQKQIKFEISW